MIAMTSSFMGAKPVLAKQPKAAASRGALVVRAGAYDEELMATAVRLCPCAAARCCWAHKLSLLHGERTQGIRQGTPR